VPDGELTSGADVTGGDKPCPDDVPGIAHEIFDALPVAVIVFGGSEHRILAANKVCRAFLGSDDLLGRTTSETFPELVAQQMSELLDHVFTTGQAQFARDWRLQFDRGQGAARDTYLDFVCAPWHGPDGAVAGVMAAGSDTTAQVQQRREALRRAADADQRYQAARDVAAELQRALLPTALPVLPQVRLAARYLVAGREQAAGGDWFDAIVLDDGMVALVVGDVVGHGVTASAAMGQLRAVLSDRLMANSDLLSALAETDAFATRTPALHAATMAVVVLDPVEGTMAYATCGHPPPLVVGTDGRTRFLPSTGSGPLGTGSAPVMSPAMLEPGEVIFLYSDGLIERPGRTAAASMAELAKVAANAALNKTMPVGAAATATSRVCQLTVELLTRTGYADDVTTLAAQRLAAPVPALQLELPSTLTALTQARRALAEWLQLLDASAEDRASLQLAVAEIVSNAAEHAYPVGRPGLIGLDVALCDGGYVECRVTDHGKWRPPGDPDGGRGHGLMIVEHLIDDVVVSHPPQVSRAPRGTRGTMVTLRHRFHQPAVLGSGAGSGGAVPEDDEQPLEVSASVAAARATARVHGQVDGLSAEELTRQLMSVSGGGTLPLTVDLSRVSQLASAGVSALFEVRDQLAAQGQQLTLLATAGSTVAFVLDLVRLPYRDAGAATTTP
jgi:serine phosphatase RsbU (regulator of sigma subunit)/anti-sigma regulatory factor (Ser/Thr protein kinase)/ABC-type transporter Mla MlaB component